MRLEMESKRLEEVKDFKCLRGYVMQRNGGQEVLVRDRVRKAVAVMSVWGKKRLGGELGKMAVVIQWVGVDSVGI